MLSREVQPSKAYSSILSSAAGKVKERRLPQLWNALAGITVTPSGMVIFLSALQPEKAESPI